MRQPDSGAGPRGDDPPSTPRREASSASGAGPRGDDPPSTPRRGANSASGASPRGDDPPSTPRRGASSASCQRSRAGGWVPEVAGILTAGQVVSTGHAIAAVQQRGGAIGWPDGHVDAWNHVECAMALSVCGLRDASRRAYEWLRVSQRADGSWHKLTPELETDLTTESNHAAYCAVGVWHELLVSRDEGFARRMWPMVKAAVDFVLGLQTPRGEIIWQREHVLQPALRDQPRRVPGRAAARLGTRRRPARPRRREAPRGVRGQEPVLDGLVLSGARRSGAR